MSQPPKQPKQSAPARPSQPVNPNRPPPSDIALPSSYSGPVSAPTTSKTSKLPKLSQSEFTSVLMDCENAIRDVKCVVFRVTASWCGTCKKADFTASCNQLKESVTSNPNVKYYDFDWDSHVSVIGMLEIIETTVPYFKIFHKGNLVKTYSGTKSMKEIEKAIEEYSK